MHLCYPVPEGHRGTHESEAKIISLPQRGDLSFDLLCLSFFLSFAEGDPKAIRRRSEGDPKAIRRRSEGDPMHLIPKVRCTRSPLYPKEVIVEGNLPYSEAKKG